MNKMRYIPTCALAVCIAASPLALPADFVSAQKPGQQNQEKEIQKKQSVSSWDKSSLSFIEENPDSAETITAVVQNGSDSGEMQGEVQYEVFWSEEGNPKNGTVIASGTIEPLAPGETETLSYTPEKETSGNFMFKAEQRPGHPGTGILWSESVSAEDTQACSQLIDPERPLDQFFQSDVDGGQATFTVPDCMKPVEISFTSYTYAEDTNPLEDGYPLEGQKSYDNVTHVYGPGTHSVEVELPKDYWQTDLYLGPEIEALTEAGHPIDLIIDADSGHTPD